MTAAANVAIVRPVFPPYDPGRLRPTSDDPRVGFLAESFVEASALGATKTRAAILGGVACACIAPVGLDSVALRGVRG